MTFADWMILVAFLLPYGCSAIAKRLSKDFDNATPRNKDVFQGVALRAYNAQQNGFEVFPFFAVAVLFAEYRSVQIPHLALLAGVFVALRILYIVVYLQNKPTQRSIVFTLSLLCMILIFLLPFLYSLLGAFFFQSA